MSRKMNRRDFIKLLTAGTGGLVIVACTPETITVIETQEVIKEVTPTAAAQVQAQVADVMGSFPRRESLIVRMLTGRVGTPDNMNLWVGWKNQDRGLQNLADEPLWSVDFATGDGVTAHALLYRPTNPEVEGPPDERPPLVVMIHGGALETSHGEFDLQDHLAGSTAGLELARRTRGANEGTEYGPPLARIAVTAASFYSLRSVDRLVMVVMVVAAHAGSR